MHSVLKKRRERDTSKCSLGACAEKKPSSQLRAINTELVAELMTGNNGTGLKKKCCQLMWWVVNDKYIMTSTSQCKLKMIPVGIRN